MNRLIDNRRCSKSLILTMAIVVGLCVQMGQYGAAAFVFCLLVDAVMPAE